jgi:hypothetical protein
LPKPDHPRIAGVPAAECRIDAREQPSGADAHGGGGKTTA